MLRPFLLANIAGLSLAFPSFAQEAAAAAHLAPEPSAQGSPPEAQLSPPEHAEKEAPIQELTLVHNPAFPAFPSGRLEAVPLARGKKFELADLKSYFAEGALYAAKEAFDAGKYEKALMLLSSLSETSALQRAPVRYLRAVSLFRLQKWAESAQAFNALVDAYPPLRDRSLFYAGQALEQLERLSEAANAYAQVEEGSRLFADARLALFRARRKLKDVAGARAALLPLSTLLAPPGGRDVGAEALWLISELSRQTGDDNGEKEALFTLWSRHPLWKEGDRVGQRLSALSARVSSELKVTRAEVLIEAHRNRQGLEVLKPLLGALKVPTPLGCRAHFLYGKGLRKERAHAQAAAVLSKVVDACEEPDLRARALYVLGSSRSIVDFEGGVETYLSLANEFPQHSFADDALFYAADLYVKNGKPKDALVVLADLVERYPSGDFQSEARFKRYWILRSLGEKEEAISTLEAMRREFHLAEEGYDFERATYWRARTHELSNELDQAVKLYEELVFEHPATYYGLLAEGRLANLRAPQSFAIPKVGRPLWPLYAGALSDDPHFAAGVELIRLGLPDEASSELLAASRAALPADSAKLMVQLFSLAQDARSAHAIARMALRRELSGKITEDNRTVWEVAYPNAYRPAIEASCRSAQVDPNILQALMREESALDPRALSWAGALGLTQLMPSTAREVAKRLKLPAPSPAALLKPELNIRLGAAYLGTLLSQFRGEKVYALASYNAGALSVKRWRTDKKDLSLDEWVEEIPLAETRGYVKRVLRSFRAYQLLYASPVFLQTARRR